MLGCVRGGRRLRHGDHICWIYGSDEEHREVLTHFLKEGLEGNERVLYLTRHFTDETVMEYLREAGGASEGGVPPRARGVLQFEGRRLRGGGGPGRRTGH